MINTSKVIFTNMKKNACYSALIVLSLIAGGCKKESDESASEKIPGYDISSLDSTAKACDDFDKGAGLRRALFGIERQPDDGAVSH
jgi:hypothetical protein